MMHQIAQQILRQIHEAATGLRETVGATDHLMVQMEPAPKVYCVSCGMHIYYLREDGGTVRFAPVEGGHSERSDLICPRCGKSFVAYLGGAPMIRTDGGWK